jgi:hypothetical protein
MLNKRLKLFSEVPYRRAFYFGDKPKRIWLKVSETEAILTGAGTSGKRHVINPGVLVILVSVHI